MRRERDLLSSVCHDLRAPLASIVMGAGFLRRVLHPEEAAALRVVDAIHRAATQMNHLIATFSDLARLQSQELKLDPRPEGVRAIAREASEQFLAEARTHAVGASVEEEPDAGDWLVKCDRERLLQALRMVTSCALRVLPAGASLVMRTGADGSGAVRFEVEARRGGQDTRPLAPELPKPELAIARGLVDLHGGHLEIAGDGERLSLSFTLPGARAPQPPMRP